MSASSGGIVASRMTHMCPAHGDGLSGRNDSVGIGLLYRISLHHPCEIPPDSATVENREPARGTDSRRSRLPHPHLFQEARVFPQPRVARDRAQLGGRLRPMRADSRGRPVARGLPCVPTGHAKCSYLRSENSDEGPPSFCPLCSRRHLGLRTGHRRTRSRARHQLENRIGYRIRR